MFSEWGHMPSETMVHMVNLQQVKPHDKSNHGRHDMMIFIKWGHAPSETGIIYVVIMFNKWGQAHSETGICGNVQWSHTPSETGTCSNETGIFYVVIIEFNKWGQALSETGIYVVMFSEATHTVKLVHVVMKLVPYNLCGNHVQ